MNCYDMRLLLGTQKSMDKIAQKTLTKECIIYGKRKITVEYSPTAQSQAPLREEMTLSL
jgi:hypothetical protein